MTEYTIRRSDRARRLRIVVAPEGVEVVLPRRMALRHAEEFVAEKRPWIERTLRQYRAAEASLPPVRLRGGGASPAAGAAGGGGGGAFSGPPPADSRARGAVAHASGRQPPREHAPRR